MIKLTYKEPTSAVTLSLWIAKDEIAYFSRESETPKTAIIQINGRNPFTLICLKSGRNLMVDETPEQILEMMKG